MNHLFYAIPSHLCGDQEDNFQMVSQIIIPVFDIELKCLTHQQMMSMDGDLLSYVVIRGNYAVRYVVSFFKNHYL